jgi:hypothetical protein
MVVAVSGLKNRYMLHKIFKKKATPSQQQLLSEWEQKGRPAPPPHIVKQNIIKEYQQKYHTSILVETGTYMGDMVAAMCNSFNQIFSIELSEKLHRKAVKKFSTYSHIHLLQGDSGKQLNEIVKQLNEPALFWLDGHYSGGITAMGDKECPVPEELATILTSNYKHVILIDDARLFNGTHDYPTIEQVENILQSYGAKYNLDNQDDVLRLTPKN